VHDFMGRRGKDETRLRVLLLEMDGGASGALLLRDGGFEVLAVNEAQELPAMLLRFAPHALVVALARPTLELAAELRAMKLGARAPVLIVSAEAEERCVTELLKAGASGFLLGEDVGCVSTAVRDVVRGGAPMSQRVSRLVLTRARRSSAKMPAVVLPTAPPAPALTLTPRQRAILELLAEGHSYEDIGCALSVSVNTVRTHVRMMYERLGASTRLEAVMAAMDGGLITRGR